MFCKLQTILKPDFDLCDRDHRYPVDQRFEYLCINCAALLGSILQILQHDLCSPDLTVFAGRFQNVPAKTAQFFQLPVDLICLR